MKAKTKFQMITICLFAVSLHAANKPVISIVARNWNSKESGDSAEIQVWAEEKVTKDIIVKYKLEGTAQSGVDFKAIPFNAIIKTGTQFTGNIFIVPIEDTLIEGEENIGIAVIPDPSYEIQKRGAKASITIADNDGAIAEFIGWGTIEKEAARFPKITVKLDNAINIDAKVKYSVQSILAKSGMDYKLNAGTLVISAGKLLADIPLEIINDSIPEDDETVIIRLSNESGVNIGRDDRFTYVIANDDGPLETSAIHDKIFGCLLGFHAGCAMGFGIETWGWNDIDSAYGKNRIEREFGWYDRAPMRTEDGAERLRAMANAIVVKQNRIDADDILDSWNSDGDVDDLVELGMKHDVTLLTHCKWGALADDFPNTKFGSIDGLCPNRHYTARVFQAIACINAGDPYNSIIDMKKTGKIYYEFVDDKAYDFGAVYHAALTTAMLPGATVNSVIEGALKYGSEECQKELRHALAIVDRYNDPKSRAMRDEITAMYSDPKSLYYAEGRMRVFKLSSIFENVGVALCCFKAAKGDAKLAIEIALNYGRDADCNAASTGALAGALAGSKGFPLFWVEAIDYALLNNSPGMYHNNHMTLKALSDALYRAVQNKLEGYKTIVALEKSKKKALTEDLRNIENHVSLMQKLSVIR